MPIFRFFGRYSHGGYIWGKLSFSCEIVQYRKTLISIFQQFSASIKEFLGSGEHWALGYNSMEFWDFPNLS